MNKNRLLILILAIGITLVGCGASEQADDGTLTIVTTTGMIGDTAANIGGDLVTVTSLMGPGVDPHLYKASAGDVTRLGNADLILYNGLHLEAKMGEVLENMGGRTPTTAVAEIFDASQMVNAEDYESSYDPHVWFDVLLWKEVARTIRDAMVAVAPEHQAAFDANLQSYLAELDTLQAFAVESLADIPAERRVIITAHDAFQYFGRAYGFEVRGLQGISTVSEAGTADVQDLADFIAQRQIPAIFIESSVPRKNVEALQAAVQSRGFDVQIGGELFSDAMGDAGTVEGTYLGMVRHNVTTIASAFAGSNQ